MLSCFTVDWIAKRKPFKNVPRGLEYLTSIEFPVVKHFMGELPDNIVLPYEVSRKYKLFDTFGKIVYYIFEEKGNVCDDFFEMRRTFKIHVADRECVTVFTIERPYRCWQGFPWLACTSVCKDKLTVYTNNGETLGYVRSVFSLIKPKFTIQNDRQEPKYEILGPVLRCKCCNPTLQFVIRNDISMTANKTPQKIGVVTRQFSANKKHQVLTTDVDAFGFAVPPDMPVRLKAVVIGAAFLINTGYYDSPKPKYYPSRESLAPKADEKENEVPAAKISEKPETKEPDSQETASSVAGESLVSTGVTEGPGAPAV